VPEPPLHSVSELELDPLAGAPIELTEQMPAAPRRITARPRLGRRRRGRIAVALAAGWLLLVIALAISADLLPLKHYGEISTEYRLRPAFRWHEPLGTDDLGRSELSRVIYGLRVSLVVALGAVAIAMAVGLCLGVVAGYLRGWVERIFDLLTDVMLAFPPLLFLLALSAALQPGFRTLTVSLALLALPTLAKVVRANTLTFASREFVLAAKAMGATRRRIIFRELVPNVMLPAMSVSFLSIAGLMVAEGSLSFLGRGIPPPTPSLGGMVAAGRASLRTDSFLVWVPGLVLLLTVYSLNTLGEHARARIAQRNPDL
jgi:peptide/nickel transport system permease protein